MEKYRKTVRKCGGLGCLWAGSFVPLVGVRVGVANIFLLIDRMLQATNKIMKNN